MTTTTCNRIARHLTIANFADWLQHCPANIEFHHRSATDNVLARWATAVARHYGNYGVPECYAITDSNTITVLKNGKPLMVCKMAKWMQEYDNSLAFVLFCKQKRVASLQDCLDVLESIMPKYKR